MLGFQLIFWFLSGFDIFCFTLGSVRFNGSFLLDCMWFLQETYVQHKWRHIFHTVSWICLWSYVACDSNSFTLPHNANACFLFQQQPPFCGDNRKKTIDKVCFTCSGGRGGRRAGGRCTEKSIAASWNSDVWSYCMLLKEFKVSTACKLIIILLKPSYLLKCLKLYRSVHCIETFKRSDVSHPHPPPLTSLLPNPSPPHHTHTLS